MHLAGGKRSRQKKHPVWSCAPLMRLLWLTAPSPISNTSQWTWRERGQICTPINTQLRNAAGLSGFEAGERCLDDLFDVAIEPFSERGLMCNPTGWAKKVYLAMSRKKDRPAYVDASKSQT